MSDKIAAVWARVSTEPQQSLDSQAARAKAELEKHGYVVPPERILKADWTSLDLFHCPYFEELNRWIVNEEISALGILDRDRLNAIGSQRLLFLSDCKEHNVELVICQGPPVLNEPEGELLELALALGKQRQVLRAQQGSRDALRERATVKGLPTTCQAPYGYDWDESRTKLIANQNWENRKLIIDLFIGGMTLKGIVKDMASRGIPSPNGREYWVEPTLSLILKDSVNFGEYRALRRENVEPVERRGQTYGKTSSKHHPGIVLANIQIESPVATQAQHEWIQQKLARNKLNSKRNGKRNYLLRGLIYYEGDNVRYFGHDIRHKSWAYRHSIRGGNNYNPRPYLPGRKLEAAVEARVREVLTCDSVLEGELGRGEAAIRDSIASLEKEMKRLEKKQNENISAESRLVDLQVRNRISDVAYERQRSMIMTERDWIAEERAETLEKLDQLRRNSASLIGLEKLRKQMAEKLDSTEFTDRRFVLEALGTKVRVTTDGDVEIDFLIPDCDPESVLAELNAPLNACPRY